MANRAAKSGLSADIQKKINDKYDPKAAQDCLQWVKDILSENKLEGPTDTSGDPQNVHAQLKNGLILARLASVIVPNSVSPNKLSKVPTLPFKQMELIGIFVDKAKEFGVPDTELFQTVDLFDNTNLHQVVIGLSSVARKAKAKGMTGYGPSESAANVRSFTDEQLKAGQNVIGLQMGSNKGASQAGQNFGKSRHIVD